jgi:DNA-binding NarL/FixJ family response regulator
MSQRLSSEAADEGRRDHLRKALAEAGGTEGEALGDGLMVAFGSASAALGCTVAMQGSRHPQAVNRRGLRDLLWPHDDLSVVGEASTAEEALREIPTTDPDVSILDVRLGGPAEMTGIEVCREIRSADPSVACIMLTSFADDEVVLAAVMAGASGYVLKLIHGVDLVNAVRRVAAGESLLDPGLAANVLERFGKQASKLDPLAGLTPRNGGSSTT